VSGTVVAWGCGGGNDFGQCTVPGGLAGVTAIAAGSYHSLALKGDGTVVAWGCGAGLSPSGQCNVPAGLSGVKAIAAGTYHSLALRADGSVVAWGCGGGGAAKCSVPDGLSGVTAIAAGAFHSLALKRDGTVVAWGCGVGVNESTDFGQCGVPAGLSSVTAIAAGAAQSLALKSDGTVVAWGCGPRLDAGQCSVPAGLSGVTAIAAGLVYHSLALKNDGSVIGWGCVAGPVIFGPSFGQCGEPKFAPVTAISAGFAHNLALRNDRKVVAWGCGGNFNLGQCSVPSGLAGVTAIAASFYHSLALIGPTPSIGLLSARASGNVVLVRVKISGWKLYPALVGMKPNKPDGGHWRIVVDGKSNSISTNSTAGRTTKLKPGKHKIWVKLVNNDHSDVAGTRPSRPFTVVVKRPG
jgi:alpha-tubulin suppressor-like RCC1 family protein